MNSGIQDAFNLAWKLALVCHGHCTSALLDSYEAERRAVAETITASGDAIEQVQFITDPDQRRTRDETIRAVFADPNDDALISARSAMRGLVGGQGDSAPYRASFTRPAERNLRIASVPKKSCLDTSWTFFSG